MNVPLTQPTMTTPQSFLTEAEASLFYAQGDAAHDFDHVRRVTRLGVRIAAAEDADVTVVWLAALLHDVPVTDKKLGASMRVGHHLAAAGFAQRLLTERGLELERVANVVHCIEAHRFRERSIQPQTLEARCLYDADKLDSIGAIGVGRAFAFAGAQGSRLWTEPWRSAPTDANQPAGVEYTPVHEFVYKLQRLHATLFTGTARVVAAQRHQFMMAFYDQLDAEMLGMA
jgi:uncharacterized protein